MARKSQPGSEAGVSAQAIDAVVWFSALIDARERSLFEKAAQAQRQLEKLGIQVKFTEGRTGGRAA